MRGVIVPMGGAAPIRAYRLMRDGIIQQAKLKSQEPRVAVTCLQTTKEPFPTRPSHCAPGPRSRATPYATMTEASSQNTHPLFELFMSTRPHRDTPSDFELYALNAILSLQQRRQTGDDHRPQSAANALSPSPMIRTPLDQGVARTPSAAPYAFDRRIPVPLLKCPKPVFTAFTTKYKLSPSLIEVLLAARARKANRKFKRMSRNRRATHPCKYVNPESDEEGDCSVIDAEAIYAQLMAASESRGAP